MYRLSVTILKRFRRSVNYYNNFLNFIPDLIKQFANSALPFRKAKLRNLLSVSVNLYTIGKADRKSRNRRYN